MTIHQYRQQIIGNGGVAGVAPGAPVAFTETTADLEIYVDAATGSDTTGNGTAAAPYATITRAYEQVPHFIKHAVQIHIAAGTYTEFPHIIQNQCDGAGQLVFDGGDISDDLGTITSANSAPVAQVYGGFVTVIEDVTVSGASWSVNEHVGKLINITSGSCAGKVVCVYSNTSDTLRVLCGHMAYIDTGDTFTIGMPSVLIQPTEPVFVRMLGADSYDSTSDAASIFGLGGLQFDFSSGAGGFHFSGTDLRIVRCHIKTADNPAIKLVDGSINNAALYDESKGFTSPPSYAFFSECFVLDSRHLSVRASRVNGCKAATTAKLITSMDSGDLSYLNACHFASVEVYFRNTVYLSFSSIGPTTVDCVDIDFASYLEVEGCYFMGGKSIAKVQELGKLYYNSCSQVSASNFSQYGLNLVENCLVVLNDSNPVGNLGGTYFHQIDTVFPNPTSGLSTTDGQGSRVTNKRV